MTTIELTNFINTISYDEIRDFYFSHSEEDFRQKYNLSFNNLRLIKKEFNLYFTKDQINQKRKATGNSKVISKENKCKTLIQRITKE